MPSGGPNRGARKLLPRWQRQRHRPNAVKANYTGLRAEPEITVRRLGDCVDRPWQESVATGPCPMRVLTYIQRRIQRKSMGTPEQHENRAKRNECSRGLYLCFGPLHLGNILIPGRAEERGKIAGHQGAGCHRSEVA